MQIEPLNMGQYPPSPCVEDEHTALANEHITDGVLEVSKSDNQGAMSRGAVDQYPILIHTADVERAGTETSKQTEMGKRQKHESLTSDVSSSEESLGPRTPPPVSGKEERKSYRSQSRTQPQPQHQQPNLTPAPAVNSPVVVERASPPQARPQVTRIRTDVGSDHHTTVTYDQRQPSPYLVNRASTFHNLDARHASAAESYLSPSFNPASPRSPRTYYGDSAGAHSHSYDQSRMPPTSRTPYSEHRTPTNGPMRANTDRVDDRSNRREVPTIRYGAQPQTEARSPRPSVSENHRRSYYEVPNRTHTASAQTSPSTSRRPSNISTYGSSGEDLTNGYRPTHSRRTSTTTQDIAYTSSTDESSHAYSRKSGKSSEDELKKARRRSSHRKERPILVDMGRDSRPGSQPASAIDGSESRHYRHEPRHLSQYSMPTPFSSDPSQVENIFEKAFRDNDSKWYQNTSGPRSSGSVLVSPLASPPRTPRSEMSGKDYFDAGSNAQKQPQHSRPPSMDEAKNPTLLSVATAGAAMAARGSSTSSRSSAPSAEATINSPRSRKPSTVIEEPTKISRSMSSGPTGQAQPIRTPLTPTFDTRPISRGSTTSNDGSHNRTHPVHPVQSVPHPYRTMSHSGLGIEQAQPWNGSYPSSTITPTNPNFPVSLRYNNFPPQSRSARTSINVNEPLLPMSAAFNLPPCPRPHPVAGYRDWYTLKETSDIDICPACVGVINDTQYRGLLIPSLARPYNEPSVCAMSKPWARVAFLQALRRNRTNLSSIRSVTNTHRDTRPCAGSKGDIRRWFHVTDPRTKEPIPDFFVCTACVCAVDEVFPDICGIFERPKHNLNQEKVCSLHTGHKHFQSIIDQLEQTENRLKGHRWRSADIEPLVRHLNRVARYRPCPRDEMQTSKLWHFPPEFPAFTICEECYDEVVWPVHDKRVARDISKTLQPVPPEKGPDGNIYGISCQLYSDRMRHFFKDAVATRDIKSLEVAVSRRVEAQRVLAETGKGLQKQLRLGIDCHQEIEKNKKAWKLFE